ncbi:MAG TPA: ABC transporter substrate-binding protein [Candidatus Micrarchaeia archaeon]|nr:ABC transporter substrate-binding protein [Candidatus Micrarchaeia archaeon]
MVTSLHRIRTGIGAGGPRPGRRRWRAALAAAAAGAAVLGSALVGLASVGTRAAPRGTVTFALPPGEYCNYISPFINGPESNNIDLFQCEYFLYRPLYWFGNHGQFTINYNLSMGEKPVSSNHGRTVTITLKHYLWSDGRPVTNRDIELWMHILMAEKAQWVGYVPGDIPDNITSMSFPKSTPETFSLTFNRAYGSTWLLYNNLSMIFAIPQHAWDRTSAAGPIGNYDRTTPGAARVWKYIDGQSKQETTYTTNPMWKVVDGPFKLAAYTPATGFAAFVPNPNYSGPQKPRIARFEEIPFTSDTAEFDALRAGTLDFGYLPTQDLDQKSYFTSRGYTVNPWVDWGFNNFWINYTNPKVGAIFKQLYVRQAMQRLVDQNRIVKDIYHGQAYPTYGPVPVLPKSAYLSRYEASDPYPFSVSAARRLLSSHGWSVHRNGVDTCRKAGTGTGDCGAGIAAGAAMSFNVISSPGSVAFNAEMAVIQSDWTLAGIHLTISQTPEATLFAELVPCNKQTKAGCSWQIANFGQPGSTPTYSPQYLPTAAMWIGSGGSNNAAGYKSPELDRLIAQTSLVAGVTPFFAEQNYAAKNLPVIWEPDYYYQLSVISPHLKGALPQDPNLNIYPQAWSVSG